MIFREFEIPGLIFIEPAVFADERGFFMETYKESLFKKNGITERFVQDNFSKSTRGVVRGLHFQNGSKAQGKLIRVASGRVWDVAVDIRPSSPTFLKWAAIEIDDTNKRMLYIPPGFAHGFAALSSEVLFHYKCTQEYDKNAEGGIRWDDPDIGIKWPLDNPVVSGKDKNLPLFSGHKTL